MFRRSLGVLRILVTGSAGFIGYHMARRLLGDGHEVIGLDGMTPYYDVMLKEARHALLSRANGFSGITGMLEDREALRLAAELAAPDVIVHLAAQAGVRYAMENPDAYISANLVGSWNVIELARTLGLTERYELETGPATGGVDSHWFAYANVPAATILHFPYDEYHLPAEAPELVDEQLMEDALTLALALVESQLERPVAR